MANRPKRAKVDCCHELIRACKRCYERGDVAVVEDVLGRIAETIENLKAEERRVSGHNGVRVKMADLLEEQAKLLRYHPPMRPRLVESEKAAADLVRVSAELVEATLQDQNLTLGRVQCILRSALDTWAVTLIHIDGHAPVHDDAWMTNYAQDETAKFRSLVLALQTPIIELTARGISSSTAFKGNEALRQALQDALPPGAPNALPNGYQGALPLVWRRFPPHQDA